MGQPSGWPYFMESKFFPGLCVVDHPKHGQVAMFMDHAVASGFRIIPFVKAVVFGEEVDLIPNTRHQTVSGRVLDTKRLSF